jgi:hypothetical protein
VDARQLFPASPAIFAPVEMDGFGADVNDFFIGWIDGYCPDIALEDSFPALARVFRAVDSITSEPQLDNVRLSPRPIHGIDGSCLK